jgi:transposase InsO family protein
VSISLNLTWSNPLRGFSLQKTRRGSVNWTLRHFRSRAFVRVLENNDLTGNTERVASAADNAAIELFHSLLRKNVLNNRRSESKEELRLRMVTSIEKKYHPQRRKERLGRITPVEFEALHEASKEA